MIWDRVATSVCVVCGASWTMTTQCHHCYPLTERTIVAQLDTLRILHCNAAACQLKITDTRCHSSFTIYGMKITAIKKLLIDSSVATESKMLKKISDRPTRLAAVFGGTFADFFFARAQIQFSCDEKKSGKVLCDALYSAIVFASCVV